MQRIAQQVKAIYNKFFRTRKKILADCRRQYRRWRRKHVTVLITLASSEQKQILQQQYQNIARYHLLGYRVIVIPRLSKTECIEMLNRYY